MNGYLLLKAVRKHTSTKWVLLYIERWLTAPLQLADGTLVQRTAGTPQGSVVSPVLANLFMHYAFDAWMCRTHPSIPWCRYADDGLLHCKTEHQAQALRDALGQRFAECGLELHSDKTRIVYCKDSNRKDDHPSPKFDFLGYTFRPRMARNSKGQLFVNFTPAVSKSAMKSMTTRIRRSNLRNRTDLDLNGIATWFNPILRGWINYYGRYHRSALRRLFRHFNRTLIAWAMRKYKRLRGHKTRAGKWLSAIASREPTMFAHWERGSVGSFA